MIIIPAIDLIDGKCVRLTEGDFSTKKEYSSNPLKTAEYFKSIGATRIHIIDLDGAKEGKSKNRQIIKEIKKQTDIEVETGGGIRTEDDVKELIDIGVDYMILGTILVKDFDLVRKMLKNYSEKFIAGIDIKDGIVKTHGWTDDEGHDYIEFGKMLYNEGFKTAIITDISKDGKLAGPNYEITKSLSIKTGLKTILSGGISCLDDIKKAKDLEEYGTTGVIVGKAYYEGKVDLKEAIKFFK